MPLISDLAKVSKTQGIAAAVALGLLAALLYVVKGQADTSIMNAQRIEELAATVDALGDLVISTCGASPQDIQRLEDVKRGRSALKR